MTKMDGLSDRVTLTDVQFLNSGKEPDFDITVSYERNGDNVFTSFTVKNAATEAGKDQSDEHTNDDAKETTPIAPKPFKGKLSYLKLPFFSYGRVSCFSLILLSLLLFIYVLNQADRLVLPVVIPAGLRCNVQTNRTCLPKTISNHANQSVRRDEATLQRQGAAFVANVTPTTSGEDCIPFSDTDQGLLTGPAFTVIYVIAGLPFARLADLTSRPLVLILGLTFWSAMVLATGFVATFWELLLLRIFLGVGEATCNPVAYSLIADFFPPKHRAVALSIYHFGVYLGGGIGYICGALNHYLSWRWTYHILGIIGLATVPFSLITAWEPKSVKASRKRRKEEKKKNSTLREVCKFMFKPSYVASTYWMLIFAGSVRNIAGYALGAWLPTFFVVEYCVSSDDYGIKVGLVVLFGGGLGSFLGGFLSDRLAKWFPHSKAFVISVSQLLAAPAICGVLLAPNVEMAYGMLFLAYLTAETWLGPAAAVVQDITPPLMRAQASALYIGIITIVASIGPLLVTPVFDSGPGYEEYTGSGVKFGLLFVVPTTYFVSSILFALLGVLIWFGYKNHKLQQMYAEFKDEQDEDTTGPEPLANHK